jgi:hypothetical protein
MSQSTNDSYPTAIKVAFILRNEKLIAELEQLARSFRSKGKDEFWSEHSVVLPAKLARAYPQDVTILPENAFFWPLWHDDHLDWIFRSNRPIPLDQTYANHLWESCGWLFLENLTPGEVRAQDTNFHRWARPYLDDLPDYGAPSNVGYHRALGRIRKYRRLQTLKKRTHVEHCR